MFVDPFLLIITIVMVIILIFANIYFVAHYAHHADSFFGGSAACKAILVSFCLFLTYSGRSWATSLQSAKYSCCLWTLQMRTRIQTST